MIAARGRQQVAWWWWMMPRGVRVLLGSYGAMHSPISYPQPVSYLHVQLKDGEVWTYPPPANHDIA